MQVPANQNYLEHPAREPKRAPVLSFRARAYLLTQKRLTFFHRYQMRALIKIVSRVTEFLFFSFFGFCAVLGD